MKFNRSWLIPLCSVSGGHVQFFGTGLQGSGINFRKRYMWTTWNNLTTRASGPFLIVTNFEKYSKDYTCLLVKDQGSFHFYKNQVIARLLGQLLLGKATSTSQMESMLPTEWCEKSSFPNTTVFRRQLIGQMMQRTPTPDTTTTPLACSSTTLNPEGGLLVWRPAKMEGFRALWFLSQL